MITYKQEPDTDVVMAVHWHDASQHSGYYNAEQAAELTEGKGGTMVSIGYVVAHNDDYMLLAQTRNLYKWGDILRIPKDCVIDLTVLSPSKDFAPNWVNERQAK